MGLSDREYYREEQPRGFDLSGPRTMVTNLILINVGIFLVDALLLQPDHWLSAGMGMKIGSLTEPWNWWQLLTSGFAHDPTTIMHVGGNMLLLFFLGRDVEQRYGRMEFLRIYLVMIVLSAFVWALCGKFFMDYGPQHLCYGASGAVSGILVLFAMNFPRRTILFMFFIPMPAWVFGAIIIGMDVVNSFDSTSQTAHSAHLAGAAFAFAYYKGRWNLGRMLPGKLRWPTKAMTRKPKLRVHAPDDVYNNLDGEADRVLDKVHRYGEESLTPQERTTLEAYSRRMQQKHR